MKKKTIILSMLLLILSFISCSSENDPISSNSSSSSINNSNSTEIILDNSSWLMVREVEKDSLNNIVLDTNYEKDSNYISFQDDSMYLFILSKPIIDSVLQPFDNFTTDSSDINIDNNLYIDSNTTSDSMFLIYKKNSIDSSKIYVNIAHYTQINDTLIVETYSNKEVNSDNLLTPEIETDNFISENATIEVIDENNIQLVSLDKRNILYLKKSNTFYNKNNFLSITQFLTALLMNFFK